MAGIAIGIGRPRVIGPAQKTIIPTPGGIPSDQSTFGRSRKHKSVWPRRIAANVKGGGVSFGGTVPEFLRIRLAVDDDRVIIEQRRQLRVPISGVGDFPIRRMLL